MADLDVHVVDEVAEAVVRDELWPLYREVFEDFNDVDSWHEQIWDRHSRRSGFRLALGRTDGRLVGLAYGYTGERGQWWTDRAATALHPDVASDWLGGHFELVSFGVEEPGRGAGIGRQLLAALTDGLPSPAGC
ncbi:GNAT family N-acetyltransferase [Nocardioides zhouii]|uniref:GNAT family N-acetyltransferase n=1 Tax=Nocardioides zhouii TaxID=1168729 RepID=A0A4Q2T1V7_9ACTN|nr:GNAT family N-acetyltransferase [Nocardioides zhouii]RYC10884.1 GNAT family N-acetyltransferase [Nocardioides zhouii]